MIVISIKHKGLKRFVEKNDHKGIGSNLVDRVRKILTALILADDMDDFIKSAPPGWRIHRLSGDRKASWSVSVSGNWRLTFEERAGELSGLDLEDYH